MERAESAPPANELASSSALSSEPRERRKRKEVVRLAPQRVEAKAAFAIPEGHGVPLGSLAGFAESLSREKDADFLKKIHRFLFASPGEASKRRANIRNFAGSAFPKDVAPEKLASWTSEWAPGGSVHLSVSSSFSQSPSSLPLFLVAQPSTSRNSRA